MEGFKTNPKMAKNIACYKEGGSVKYKSRHSEKSEMKEDVAQDKAMIKKAVKMHDEQQHGGKDTNLSKLKKGGRMKKEGGCVGRYKSGGGVSYGAKKSGADIKEIAAIKRTKPKVKTGGSDVAKDGGKMTGGADIKTGMKTGSSDVKKEGSVTGSSDANKDGGITMGLNNMFKKGGAAKKYADGRLVGQGAVTDAERSLVSGLTGQGAVSATEKARLANRARNRAMLSPAQQQELDAQELEAARAAMASGQRNVGGIDVSPMGKIMGRKNGGKMKKCNTGGSTGPISQTTQEIIEGKRPAQATPGKMTPEERRASIGKAFGAK